MFPDTILHSLRLSVHSLFCLSIIDRRAFIFKSTVTGRHEHFVSCDNKGLSTKAKEKGNTPN